jgi:hypothetical protein
VLFCDETRLTALNVSKNTALWGLSCSNNRLTAIALNKMFETLHENTIDIEGETKNIGIGDNPGTDTCNTGIATHKGWEVGK